MYSIARSRAFSLSNLERFEVSSYVMVSSRLLIDEDVHLLKVYWYLYVGGMSMMYQARDAAS